MGTPPSDGAQTKSAAPSIDTYYSDRTWIDSAASAQLSQVAGLAGVKGVKAFPDLHPGKYGPVGCAVLCDRIFPQLIGNDIGCGMSLFALDMPRRKLNLYKAAKKLRAVHGLWNGNAGEYLQSAGLSDDLHPLSLGSIGGGNHFCEVQGVSEIFDENCAQAIGISKSDVLLLVHSGSRSLGAEVFSSVQDSLPDGLDAGSNAARLYLQQHDEAVIWARLNRQVIAERAASALKTGIRLIADSPHNLVEVYDGHYLHRKGAAKADIPLVPLAGSRDSLSYLLKPAGKISSAYLSLSHGAGRKYDRRSMLGRAGGTKSEREKLTRNSFGGHIVCEDKQLLIEEAPTAYKESSQVLEELLAAELATSVVSLAPLVTFKNANPARRDARNPKQVRLHQRRRTR
ncbi:MAG: RNA ligase RtcB family protein [Anderseniella sp.]